MTEGDLQQRIIDAATLLGWRVAHFRPARTVDGWRTPVQGHAGFPDLVLAKGGQVILAELKSDTGRLDPEQVRWAGAIGGRWRLWRPGDWAEIETILRSAPSWRNQ